ncbi:DNA-3-methyladenine glycosylase 2 family protein [Paenibacillus oenotherae]|uniref:DNA-3-methyladenine glycosylase II n=1 Tax=Paenibacillus oenotherae TaxID=1435645 RepID=A0ABS7D3Z2_9BACL|nr:DNA-3-methyladenine glycosylase 2 family protein [Paenibacillus oenotherae]MBW7474647.1 DNA-3-methyladenine glycosylase 2 family protein [Paenibacillus oenotherae]
MATITTKYFEYGQEALDYLKSVDETLGAAMERMGRVERVIIPDLFTALIYAIVSQLISVKAVHTIWERMQIQLGDISPANLAVQPADTIQRCGMTMRKAVCIQRIAGTIAHGAFRLEELSSLTDAEVITKLMTLDGIGRWTAEMMLINTMERPDIVSWGDIAIRRGMMKLYGLPAITKKQFDEYRRRYSPFGSVASIYLWEISFE